MYNDPSILTEKFRSSPQVWGRFLLQEEMGPPQPQGLNHNRSQLFLAGIDSLVRDWFGKGQVTQLYPMTQEGKHLLRRSMRGCLILTMGHKTWVLVSI